MNSEQTWDEFKAEKTASIINWLAGEIGEYSDNHGFRDTWRSAHQTSDPDLAELFVTQKLLLIVSEAVEAMETLRKHGVGGTGTNEYNLYDFEDFNFGEELADIVIRVLDLADMGKVNIGKAIMEKHTKNLNRPHKHGKKF
jgi:NTP pyrophosphatase (non-canonical NTP hydrolase)